MATEPFIDPSDDRFVVFPDGKRLARIRGGDGTEPEDQDEIPAPDADDRDDDDRDNAGGGDETDPFDEGFDPSSLPEELQTAHKNMQGAFTKRMQELAGKRENVERLQQLEDFVVALQDPDQQAEILRAMGVQLPDPAVDPDDDDRDPHDELTDRLSELEQRIASGDESAARQKYVEQEHAYIDSEIDTLEAKHSVKLTDDEATVVGQLAQAMADERGVPQVDKAYDRLEAIVAARRKQWVQGKKPSPRPGGGPVPRDKVDITDPEQRQAFLAAQVEGMEQGG